MTSNVSVGKGVTHGAISLFIQNFIISIMGAVYYIVMSNILSPSEIGVLAALGIIAALFVTFGTLAIPSATTRFVSEYVGRGRVDLANEVYKKTLQSGFLASAASCLLCWVTSTLIAIYFLRGSTHQVLINILALDVFALVFSLFLNGMLLGLQKFNSIAIIGITSTAVKYSLSVFLLVLGLGFTGLVLGWAIGDFVGLGLLSFVSLKPFGVTAKGEEKLFPQMIRYSFPLYLSGILGYFSATIERLIILFLAGLQTFGIYSVALTITTILTIVSTSISNSLFPKLSELYGQGGTNALKEASEGASRYLFLVFSPLAVGLSAIAYPTITLFFGMNYESGWIVLAIISFVTALTSAGIIVGNVLLSLKVTRIFFYANLVAVVAGAVLCALLIGPLGSAGAALARAGMTFVLFLLPLYELKHTFGLHLDVVAFKKSWIASLVMFGAVILLEFLWLNRYLIPLYILFGMAVYFLMLKVLKAVEAEDVELLRQLVPRRWNRLVNLAAGLLT